MTLIEWRDEFNTGIAEVDYEHAKLIELINIAHARLEAGAPASEIEGFLGNIHTWIAAHFALEEVVMKSKGYDEYESHKADHERLLDAIRDIMTTFDAGDFDGMSEDLSARLRDWFVGHFRDKDSRLHRMLGVF